MGLLSDTEDIIGTELGSFIHCLAFVEAGVSFKVLIMGCMMLERGRGTKAMVFPVLTQKERNIAVNAIHGTQKYVHGHIPRSVLVGPIWNDPAAQLVQEPVPDARRAAHPLVILRAKRELVFVDLFK
jgi:hypothetical protein